MIRETRAVAVAAVLAAISGCDGKLHVEGGTTIGRPAAQVFETLTSTDLETNQAWMPDVRKVELLTGAPLKVGSRVGMTADMGGELVPMEITYTAFEAPRMFKARQTASMMTMDWTYTFTESEGSTTVAYVGDVQMIGLLPQLMAPMMSGKMRDSMSESMARLKALVESKPAP